MPLVSDNAASITRLSISDPWRADTNYEVPPIELWFLPLVEQSGDIIEAWNEKKVASGFSIYQTGDLSGLASDLGTVLGRHFLAVRAFPPFRPSAAAVSGGGHSITKPK